MLLPGRHARLIVSKYIPDESYGEFIPHMSSDDCKASRHAKFVAILKLPKISSTSKSEGILKV